MSSTSSHSGRHAPSSRPQRVTPIASRFVGRHSSVNCLACHRSMVPRVVTYYGQPLRSVCPFCGATFMKFSSGLERLLRHFQMRTLSFTVFRGFVLAALCFGFLWSVNYWIKLPENISHLAMYGTIFFVLMALAELFVQCVELLAVRLCHESNYYWASFVFIAMVTVHERHDLTYYFILLSIVMLARWVVVGCVHVFNASKSIKFND